MVFVTVIAVSIDAYVAGLSLSEYKRVGIWATLYTALFSLIMPFAAMYLVSEASVAVGWLNTAGACIIIILGIRGLMPESCEKKLVSMTGDGPGFVRVTLLGISLAADTSAGAAALYAEDLAPAVPLMTFAAHCVLFALGLRTAGLLGASRILSRAASAVMIVLGVFRLIG